MRQCDEYLRGKTNKPQVEFRFDKSRNVRLWSRPIVRRTAAIRQLSGRTRHWAAKAKAAGLDPKRRLATVN
jgi:hypothetical protein